MNTGEFTFKHEEVIPENVSSDDVFNHVSDLQDIVDNAIFDMISNTAVEEDDSSFSREWDIDLISRVREALAKVYEEYDLKIIYPSICTEDNDDGSSARTYFKYEC